MHVKIAVVQNTKVAAAIGRWRDGDPSRFSFLHRCYVDAICCREGEDHALTTLAQRPSHHSKPLALVPGWPGLA